METFSATANILMIIAGLFLFTMTIAGLSFAPWLPTRKRDQRRIFALADMKPGETFYDLGCGDGRNVLYAAKNFQAKATGLEISLLFYTICKIRKFFGSDKNICFKFKNLFKENLSAADAVYCFGMPDTIKNKLVEKLNKEMKPGSRLISYAFPVAGLTPAVVDKPTPDDITIYCYRM